MPCFFIFVFLQWDLVMRSSFLGCVSCESPVCLRLGHYRSGMIRDRLESVRMVRASLALGYFQCLEHASVSAFTDFLAKESFSYEE